MQKAQVLVTLTAEALVEVPDGTIDVEAYCRERLDIDWGTVQVERFMQTPSVTVEHFLISPVRETEPTTSEHVSPEPVAVESEPLVAEPAPDVVAMSVAGPVEAEVEAPEPAMAATVAEVSDAPVMENLSDVDIDGLVRQAISSRAEKIISEVVAQVVTELEPLLRRHMSRQSS